MLPVGKNSGVGVGVVEVPKVNQPLELTLTVEWVPPE